MLPIKQTHSYSRNILNGAKHTEENIFVAKKKMVKNKRTNETQFKKRQNEINARWGHVYKMLFCILNRQMCFEEKCFKA